MGGRSGFASKCVTQFHVFHKVSLQNKSMVVCVSIEQSILAAIPNLTQFVSLLHFDSPQSILCIFALWFAVPLPFVPPNLHNPSQERKHNTLAVARRTYQTHCFTLRCPCYGCANVREILVLMSPSRPLSQEWLLPAASARATVSQGPGQKKS